MMLLPGFGERFVLERFKLLLALTVTLVVTPAIAPGLPKIPAAPFDLLIVMGSEIIVGLFIGMMGRIAMAALEVAGTLIAFHIGLASAMIFNPSLSEQGSLTGVMLVLVTLVVMMHTDMHHITLRAVIDSYGMFEAGRMFPTGDYTEAIVRAVSGAFRIGLQLSGPFIILAMLLNVAMALISRLMPQLQAFFLLLPVQLILGLLMIAITLPTIIMVFLDYYGSALSGVALQR